MFLFTFFGSLFYGAFLFPRIIENDLLLTVKNIQKDETLFKIGVLNEIIYSLGAIIIAILLYNYLKLVNRMISYLAILIKVIGAALLSAIALVHYIILILILNNSNAPISNYDQIKILCGIFVNQYFYVGSFIMLFHGLGFILFFYLFYKSIFIPKKISILGISSYLLIISYSLTSIFNPKISSNILLQTVLLTPSVITEILLGSWFLLKKFNNKNEI